MHTEQDWLDSVRALLLRGERTSAHATLARALSEHPKSVDLRRMQAGILLQTGQPASAERIFHTLLVQNPGDAGSAFALARLLTERGRTSAAAAVMRACLAAPQNVRDSELAIAAIELLDDCDRKRDAAAIAATAVTEAPDDPRLHAYAGMLAIQLGEFERARRHYLFALAREPFAYEWHVPIGLSSTFHYGNPDHPDFALFKAGLQRTDLSDLARAELHFALGKAYDDVRDYVHAAQYFQEGNAIRKHGANWSRKAWRRMVEARLASKPFAVTVPPIDEFVPVFIVGMPRSGTTLLAELLSRFPKMCNRGELPWIARLAQRTGLSGNALASAAKAYMIQSRQDDAAVARWFIDKQPLNFRYVGLMLAMFPQAKIVHCQRSPRDIALSLWMQCFREDVQGYAYDFDDIALVMRDEERLISHWQKLHPESIRAVRYEDVVTRTEDTVNSLAAWIGVSLHDSSVRDTVSGPASTINTASLWQARQPVNTRSIGRWKHYAPHIPGLSRFSE